MAMLISKFHRLIRNRLIWIVFLVVVVFSFVIWGTQMPDTTDQNAGMAGRLNDESISYDDFQRAKFNSYLSIYLRTGRGLDDSRETERLLNDLAWRRLATLREAAALGITAADEEVVNIITSFDFLKSEQGFALQAYNQFATQLRNEFGISKRGFDDLMREEIILQKCGSMVDRLQLATPAEIQRTFSTLTDTFGIEYVRITPDYVASNVTVSAEDVQAFFSKDPEQFTIPEKIRVKAAVFPVADYQPKVEVTDAQIEEYYDLNLEDFAKPREKAEGDTNEFTLAATEYKPLEEVKGEITQALREREAALLAKTAADEFVQALADAGKEGRAKFDAIAAEKGIQLVAPAPFAINEKPEGIEEPSTILNRAAFSLDDDDDYYYSDAIEGTNFVYVLSLIELQPSRVPEFEEVKSEVENVAREFATVNALSEKAREVRDSAAAGLTAGISFEDTLKAYALSAEKPEPFALNTIGENSTIPSSIFREILILNAGEISEPVEDMDGILIAFVKSREASAESLESLRPQIQGTLRRQVGSGAFEDYQRYLLKRDRFIDLMQRKPAGSETAAEASAGS